MPDIWSANIRTTGRIGLTGAVTGRIDRDGDIDWLRVPLQAHQWYSVALVGYTLRDPFLEVHDRTGKRLTYNDDAGGGLDSGLIFRATYTGNHFVAASSSIRNDLGTYGISIRRYTPTDPTVAASVAPASLATTRTRTMTNLLDQATARPLTTGAASSLAAAKGPSPFAGLLAGIG